MLQTNMSRLCLTRRAGQSFVIGDNVCVTINRVKDGNCRLSIVSPRSTPIVRSELIGRDDKRRQSR